MKRINRTKFYFYLTGILIFSNSFSYSATFWSEKYFSNSSLLFSLIIFINSFLFLIFLPIFLQRLNDAGFSFLYIFIPIVNLVLLLFPSKINRIDEKKDIFDCSKKLSRKDFFLLYPLPFLAVFLVFFTTYFAFLFFEMTSSGKLELFSIIIISNIIYLALHALFFVYSAFFIISLLIRRLRDVNLNPLWAFFIASKYILVAYFLEEYISDLLIDIENAKNQITFLFVSLSFFFPEIILGLIPSKKNKG